MEKTVKIVLVFFLFMNLGTNLWAQQNIFEEKIINIDLTSNGSHLLYAKKIKGDSQLVVHRISTNEQQQYNGSPLQAYLLSNYFIYKDDKLNVMVKNLETNKTDTLSNISSHEPLANKSGVVAFSKNNNQLHIYNANDKFKILNVKQYKYDNLNNQLLFFDFDNKLFKFDFVTKKQVNLNNDSVDIDAVIDILFKKESKNFFTVHLKSNKLKLVAWKNNKIDKVARYPVVDSLLNLQIDTLQLNARVIGENSVAVKMSKSSKPLTKQKIEIYTTSSNGFGGSTTEDTAKIPAIGILNLDIPDKIHLPANIPGVNFSAIGLTNNSILSFTYDHNQSYIRTYPILTYTLTNAQLTNSNKEIETSNHGRSIKFSAYSPYLFYFSKNDWYAYDPISKVDTNLTNGSVDFKAKEHFYNNALYSEPIDNIIVTTNPAIVLIYDKHDVWIYNFKKDQLKRITKGKEENNKYRIINSSFQRTNMPWQLNSEALLNWSDKLTLSYESIDHLTQGIKQYDIKSDKIKDIIQENKEINDIIVGKEKISYIAQSYNQPPQLNVLDLNTLKKTNIYASNKSDTLASNLKSEIYRWQRNGKSNQALVHFPVNYNINKTYPAIVYIYEKKTASYHHYQHSKQLKGAGINYRDYVNDGYIVIEPDITYTIGNPGVSAYNNVLEAIEELDSRIPLDKNNLGLVGHSFGGYETNFIVTQTTMFKAAVASAGFSDLVQGYLTMKWNELRPDFWQFEDNQIRMGKNLYEDYSGYLQNSPIYHANKIETPLLLWSGKSDYHVNWSQSVSLFLALKRLNKQAVLILYPNEGHVLKKTDNKLDMTIKLKQWFDYYLKDKEKPSWLN